MVIHNLNFLLSKHNMVSPAISSLRSPWKTEAFQGDPYRPCLVLRPEGARRVGEIGESEYAHESVLEHTCQVGHPPIAHLFGRCMACSDAGGRVWAAGEQGQA